MDRVNNKESFFIITGNRGTVHTYWELPQLQEDIQEANWIIFKKAKVQDTYSYLTKVSTLKHSSMARAELYSTPVNGTWIMNYHFSPE